MRRPPIWGTESKVVEVLDCDHCDIDVLDPPNMYDDDLLTVQFKHIVYVIGGLPLTAFSLCVFFAITLHFDETTRTHCHVPNYLPSISAAVGDYAPEKYIWRFFIALHCLPRFLASIAYRNFYLTSPLRPSCAVDLDVLSLKCSFLLYLHVFENASLLGLTCISSTDNHAIHALCFTTFVVSSLVYMLLTLHVFCASGRRRNSTQGEKSYQYKLLMCTACFTALFGSLYFYWRHNEYCEPGVYTLFAAFEYVFVVCNIVFHCSIILDMNDRKLVLTTNSNSQCKTI